MFSRLSRDNDRFADLELTPITPLLRQRSNEHHCPKPASANRPANATMGRRNHYHVYVIELSKDVLHEARFKKANPGYVAGKPCVYVGMTGLDPDVRFDKHKAGIQANRYAKQYGLRLLPDLYEAFNPMGYDAARDKEVEVAIELREAGFGVWQA